MLKAHEMKLNKDMDSVIDKIEALCDLAVERVESDGSIRPEVVALATAEIGAQMCMALAAFFEVAEA